MQLVFILSQREYSNILGIFTNIRQCRKHIETLTDKENLLLHGIRLNEPGTLKNISKMLEPEVKKEKINKKDVCKIDL
jgi:hypothetical protein